MKIIVSPGLTGESPRIKFSFIRDEVYKNFAGLVMESSMWMVASADFVVVYDLTRRRFVVKKDRGGDPNALNSCQKIVRNQLGIEVTRDGEWIDPADETMFLLKYGNASKIPNQICN